MEGDGTNIFIIIIYYISDNIVLCTYVFFFFLNFIFHMWMFLLVCLSFILGKKHIFGNNNVDTMSRTFNFFIFYFLFLPFDIKSTRSRLKTIKTKQSHLRESN